MREFAIIRGAKDCERVVNIVKPHVDETFDIINSLKEYLKAYKEFAFDVRTGDVLFMILENGNLSITAKITVNVSLLSNETFESAVYDINTGEILCAKKDGHLLVSGKVIYDSLNPANI